LILTRVLTQKYRRKSRVLVGERKVCQKGPSVLKNPFVPFSDPCSEAENPVLWVFWACFGTTNQSDNDFFNTLGGFWDKLLVRFGHKLFIRSSTMSRRPEAAAPDTAPVRISFTDCSAGFMTSLFGLGEAA
jgi:hypothetical protein